VGTVKGRANVAGVVTAFPDAHITIDDIFGQGDQVVVRVVVSGTQQGRHPRHPRERAPRSEGRRRRLPPEPWQDQQHLGRRRLDRDPQRHGHVQGTLDPLTPIRSGMLPRLHGFKDMGMGPRPSRRQDLGVTRAGAGPGQSGICGVSNHP
jgi:SnoaL-like polyketide cyclase